MLITLRDYLFLAIWLILCGDDDIGDELEIEPPAIIAGVIAAVGVLIIVLKVLRRGET